MVKARAKVRFVPSSYGFLVLERRTQTTVAMEAIAEKIAKRAQSNGGRFTKKYKGVALGLGKARAGTAHPFAHWDEWGTIYRTPRAPLRRALSQLGLWDQTKESR